MLTSMQVMFGHFREMRRYFVIATALFALGILLGVKSGTFESFLDEQLHQLEQTAQSLQSLSNSWVSMMLFIFMNNTIKAIVFMYLGFLLGIVPAIFLLINGMIIGYLLLKMDAQGLNVWEIIVKGLLPHGILEIPAILISSAYGIGLGVLLLKQLDPARRSKHEFRLYMKHTAMLMLFLTVVLFAAAVIESTVTPWLLQK